MPPNREQLEEIYRLERENNKMLKSMQRRAFWGGLFKIIIYLVMLGVPVWLFFTYLFPAIDQLNDTVSSMTGGRVQIGQQFQGANEWFLKVQEFFKGAASSTGK